MNVSVGLPTWDSLSLILRGYQAWLVLESAGLQRSLCSHTGALPLQVHYIRPLVTSYVDSPSPMEHRRSKLAHREPIDSFAE